MTPLENNPRFPSLAPAAFAYAGVSIIVLALLPRLESPTAVFRAPNAGMLLLGRDPVQGLLWGLGLGVALTSAGQAFTRWTPWGRRFVRLLIRMISPLHPLDALLLAGLSSLGEELVFRGLALPYLGLTASSVLFGLAHLIPRDGLWPWSLWAAAAGGALGWVALATGGLLAPLSAHFLINAVGLLLVADHGAAVPE